MPILGPARMGIEGVAGLHALFCLAELFFWETLTPRLHIFSAEQARQTAALGRNMGVYNGILAACLIWLLSAPGLTGGLAQSLATLLLASIIVAGIFGGITINRMIPLFQSLPALFALGLLWYGTPK